MNQYTYQPCNPKALLIYDVMHLFIPTDSDEREVELYSHSQGDWQELKHKHGLLWTIPTEILSGGRRCGNGYVYIDNPPKTPYDLWQWATGMGYIPQEV